LQNQNTKKNVAKQTFTKPFWKSHEKIATKQSVSQTLLKNSQKQFTKQSFTKAYLTTLPLTTTHTKSAEKQR
jgi:hypothetical protein